LQLLKYLTITVPKINIITEKNIFFYFLANQLFFSALLFLDVPILILQSSCLLPHIYQL